MSFERYLAAVDSSARHRRKAIRQRLMALAITEGDVAEVDSSVLRRRNTILQRLEVPRRNVFTYADECLFACDPRLIKKENGTHTECPKERCKVTVVALSMPVDAEAGAQRSGQMRKTIRVFQVTAFTHFIYELTFQRSDRGWTMIGKETIGGGGM